MTHIKENRVHYLTYNSRKLWPWIGVDNSISDAFLHIVNKSKNLVVKKKYCVSIASPATARKYIAIG